jgi:hypothetical protein
MVLVATLAWASIGQFPVPPGGFMPGQLEAVAGLRPCEDTTLGLYYTKDVVPKISEKLTLGGGLVTYSFGYIRFSTVEESFLGWPGWHVRWSGRTVTREGKKEIQVDTTAEFWVDKSGRIHRQRASSQGPNGSASAEADFFPDHIQIRRSIAGKDSEMSLFPASDEIDNLNAQFKPMIEDGKVLIREKSFLCLDLFRGTFEKRVARISGMFEGKELGSKFHGHAVDFEFNGFKEQACVSDDDYLVRIDLQDGKTAEMTTLPTGRAAHG